MMSKTRGHKECAGSGTRQNSGTAAESPGNFRDHGNEFIGRSPKCLAISLLCFTMAVGLAPRVTTAAEANRPAYHEHHVSPHGDDANDGSESWPLRTISAAAQRAQPGDTVTVHEGVYREQVNPLRGGESDQARIVYRAAHGENVVIKGSEVVKGWVQVRDDTWKVVIANGFFGSFNPYRDLIHGDWFNANGRSHHTGAVYLKDHWLTEAATLDDVLMPAGNTPLWFGRVDEDKTTIWAQFSNVDPNETAVEINVRQAVFYPEKPGVNYLTVRGFTMMHAATPWAPPTAEQIGLIGTHWSKGWIIEGNDIRYSACVGITLGKHGDAWDNTSQNTATGYVKTIERALENGWSKEKIGHHVVRENTISHCEQAGIVGSLGAVFSEITDNVIHDIHVRRLFSGAEMAGIKIHAAIDTEIRGNHIYRTCRGIWLDWMAQGTLVSGNLLYDNGPQEDLFVEVNHGPFLVENNLFLSATSLRNWSEGGAYAHNLMTGRIVFRPELRRSTPFHQAHSTEVAGLRNIQGGDDRFYNNVFVRPASLTDCDNMTLPVRARGNVFLMGSDPAKLENDPIVRPAFDPDIKLINDRGTVQLNITLDKSWPAAGRCRLVTTELLGEASVPDLPYEQPDGSPIRIDTDYFGRNRNPDHPFPGPIELSEGEMRVYQVWPVASHE